MVADFGRPTVSHWIGAAAASGPPARTAPQAAVLRATLLRTRVPDGEDPAATMAQAAEELSRRVSAPGVHTTALALDPHHWELVRFTLWAAAVPEDEPGDRYEVLHLSAPGLATLTGVVHP